MTEPIPIQVDFVDAKSVPTRGVFRLIFDVPIELADTALQALGGWPQPGTNRVCAVVLMNQSDC